jgi:hypothetical protein
MTGKPQFFMNAEEAETVATPYHAPVIAEPQQSGISVLIERVLRDDSIPFDKLERMLAMQERIEAAQARKSFDQAISAAKGEIPEITKNRHVGFEAKNGGAKTDYRHEDFAQIARAVDPILARHGLSYRYRTTQAEARVTVTCVLAHRDGHSEDTTLTSNVDASGNKNPIQAVGSAITYLQRYTLKAALGLAVSNDDDGKASAAPAGSINEDEFRIIRELLAKAGADEGKFLATFKVEMLEELPAAKFEAAKAMLWQKIAKAKEAGNAA